jgi:protein-tyrosine phosphatase
MSLFSSLFSKKEIIPFDLSSLKVDMHSHLIPGIDDGAATLEDSLEMLRKLESLGYRKIITTPHIKTGSFDNTTEIIKAGEKIVKEAIEKEGINLQFEAAAEYFFDYTFMERIESEDLLTFGNKNILVEYSFAQAPVGHKEMYFALQMKGYQPIMAHFERYPYYHGSTKMAEELRDKGIKIQVNILSFIGHYGPQIQKQAEMLLKENMIDLIATDCHRIEHLLLIEGNLNHKNMQKLNDLRLANQKLL